MRSKRNDWRSNPGSREQYETTTRRRDQGAAFFLTSQSESDEVKIAILPGDGIGPEIVGEATKILNVLASDGLPIETETAPIGGAGYDAHRHPLPDRTLALAREADAILLGAVGGPRYDTLPRELRPEQGILAIRKALGLFANLRPAILFPELTASSTLKADVVSGLDLMIVRELTGDIYFGEPRGRRTNAVARQDRNLHASAFISNRAPCIVLACHSTVRAAPLKKTRRLVPAPRRGLLIAHASQGCSASRFVSNARI